MIRFVVEPDEAGRIDRLLVRRYPESSRRLLGDGKVAGPGADHGDGALACGRRLLAEGDAGSHFMKDRSWLNLPHRLKLRPVAARRQNIHPRRGHAGEDTRHLIGSLALRINHFGHSRSKRAMMIDLRESEVFKRQIPETIACSFGRHFSFADRFHQLSQLFWVHAGNPCAR